eukprot:TRINITY_DN13542_c0_g1_i3.p1 TRINITY_DN13542_c0_g1~~TRINITY_DN13542_c0_g1_i3.p1  ORF type:complete len:618 (-),score=81.72 TRINITY_DN13542_c0_g1_i3:195-2048(-)
MQTTLWTLISLSCVANAAYPALDATAFSQMDDSMLAATPFTYSESDAFVQTRDNVSLYTRVFFSDQHPPSATHKQAVLYVQCPYGLSFHDGLLMQWSALSALAFPILNHSLSVGLKTGLVVQETRSIGNSTGEFDWFDHTHEDAGDTVAWIRAQAWSNGIVIPEGISAMGLTALAAGGAISPAGAAPYKPLVQYTGLTPNGLYNAAYRSGTLQFKITAGMLVFTNHSELLSTVYAHERPEWWSRSTFQQYSSVDWPTVMWAGWYDIFQKDTLRNFESYRRESHPSVRELHRLVVDPLGHCGIHNTTQPIINATAFKLVNELNAIYTFLVFKVGQSGAPWEAHLKWRLLSTVLPRIVWMVLSSEGGWLTSGSNWPTSTSSELFLSSNQSLTAQPAAQSAVSYVYDPAHPAPSIGGYQFYDTENPVACGSQDTTPLLSRDDYLRFDGPVLTAPLAITGAITATLFMSSTANDTDLVVRLVDVFPSDEHGTPGFRMLISDGVQRMRWRGNSTEPQEMVPGEVYEVEVDMWSMSYVLSAGHRIGLEVTSSSYPSYSVNPNNGLPLSVAGPNVTATNQIHLGQSRVTLPVVSLNDLPYWQPPLLSDTVSILSEHVSGLTTNV